MGRSNKKQVKISVDTIKELETLEEMRIRLRKTLNQLQDTLENTQARSKSYRTAIARVSSMAEQLRGVCKDAARIKRDQKSMPVERITVVDETHIDKKMSKAIVEKLAALGQDFHYDEDVGGLLEAEIGETIN